MNSKSNPAPLSANKIKQHKRQVKKWQDGFGDAYDMAENALEIIQSHETLRGALAAEKARHRWHYPEAEKEVEKVPPQGECVLMQTKYDAEWGPSFLAKVMDMDWWEKCTYLSGPRCRWRYIEPPKEVPDADKDSGRA